MKVIIYSRKSKFTGKGDSIGNQIKLCEEYIKSRFPNEEHSFSIFEDEGFSGKSTNRPQFKKMMRCIEGDDYDALICYKLDRIARNVSDFSSTLDTLTENNVSFISVTENFDTSTPMGRAMINIASVFAQLERETIAERVRDNMLELAKNGSWSGGKLPAGYKSEQIVFYDDVGTERKAVRLVQIEEEINLVKLIYDIYLKEGSLHKTEVYFTQHNIKSTNGIRLEKTSLKFILQNPVYVKSTDKVFKYMTDNGWTVYGQPDGVHGLLSYNKTKSVTKKGKTVKVVNDKSEWFAAIANVEGCIDDKTWIAVQEQFKKNKHLFPNLGKTHNALLVGKMVCGKCGKYMLVQHGRVAKNGEKLFYYTCSLKRKSKKELCDNSNAKTNIVEGLVLKTLYEVAKNKEKYIKSLKRLLNNNISNDLHESKNKYTFLLEQKKKQINNLIDKLSFSSDIEDLLLDKIKALKLECAEIENKILELDKSNETSSETLIHLDLISGALDQCKFIEKIDKESQKEVIDLLIDKIYWYGSGNNKGGRIRIVPKGILKDTVKKIDFSIDDLSKNNVAVSNTLHMQCNQNYNINNIFDDIDTTTTELYKNLSEITTSDKIKKLRKTLGFSQREFANYCNIGYSTLCKYESGMFNISKKNKEKICSKLNISIDYL